MVQESGRSLKNRANQILNRIELLLNTGDGNNVGKTPSSSKQVSSSERCEQEVHTNDLTSITVTIGKISKDMDALKNKMIILAGEVSDIQHPMKSLVGLDKQVSSLQATVNKLLNQRVATQNPCDTPEGLAGDIPGC